eukprot:GFYU01021760.1.p1 GENE.GFYU01021760.1~~GFYU01021760.1.p1  ORF type:complete len:465 (+),score=162.21 GFYU01021760.1:31-1425(+)
MEGEISRESVLNNLSRGQRPSGDLIPWTLSQQFQDNDFPSLSGARIVRIATHPNYNKMGYGTRAVQMLTSYYQGEIVSLREDGDDMDVEGFNNVGEEADGSLTDEVIKPRKQLPPLMVPLSERRPERLHYLGTSYGLTQGLLEFWKKNKFVPVYLRQTANELTGEHTCIMISPLSAEDLPVAAERSDWLEAFALDFRRRFTSLLGMAFNKFSVGLALSVLDMTAGKSDDGSPSHALSKTELDLHFTPYDLKRLDSYSRNLVDYHMVLDLLPRVAELFFHRKLQNINVSHVQSAIMLAIGLQRKTVDDLEAELTLPATQLLALFNKCVRKFSTHFNELAAEAAAEHIPGIKSSSKAAGSKMNPLRQTLDDEQMEAAEQVNADLKAKRAALLSNVGSKYCVADASDELEAALTDLKGKVPKGLVVKTNKTPKKYDDEPKTPKSDKKRKTGSGGKDSSVKKKKHGGK